MKGNTLLNDNNLVPLVNGGLNLDLSATGGTSRFIKQNSVGATPTVTQPAITDLSDYTGPTDISGSIGFTGFSADPTVRAAYYTKIGKQIIVHIYLVAGTSNATTFTVTGMPVAAKTLVNDIQAGFAQTTDNGVTSTSFGLVAIASGSTTLTIYKDAAGGGWTASGTKAALIQISYTTD